MTRMIGNFEIGRIVNPSVPVKQKPIYRAVYVNKHGKLQCFCRRAKIVKRGFGHRCWNYKGKDICNVRLINNRWVISHA